MKSAYDTSHLSRFSCSGCLCFLAIFFCACIFF
jgi:hypothetical protein